jgi:hypothetical protein
LSRSEPLIKPHFKRNAALLRRFAAGEIHATELGRVPHLVATDAGNSTPFRTPRRRETQRYHSDEHPLPQLAEGASRSSAATTAKRPVETTVGSLE